MLHYFACKEQLLIALLEDRDRRDAAAVTYILGLQHKEDFNRIKLTPEE